MDLKTNANGLVERIFVDISKTIKNRPKNGAQETLQEIKKLLDLSDLILSHLAVKQPVHKKKRKYTKRVKLAKDNSSKVETSPTKGPDGSALA